MSAEVIFLSLDQILTIHNIQIKRFGGSQGIRERTLLESAIFRPQSIFGGKDLYPSVFHKAAALGHSLILNHPFIDGNKRTGIESIIISLRINTIKLQLKGDQIISLALDIESKKKSIEDIAKWLREHSTSL